MTILVSGATGFIGRHLVDVMKKDHELYCLTRRESREGLPKDVRWITQDLVNPLGSEALPTNVDAVIHLAQSRHYKLFPERAADIYDVNIHSTFRLLEYARTIGAKRFIYASSGGVYGYSYERFVETDPVGPLNFYLSSKRISELLVANYQRYFTTIIFRFFFVYGPGQSEMLIPTLIQKVRNQDIIRIEGNPGLRINPIFVADAVHVFEPALNLESHALINVAGDTEVTITELVNLIQKASGKNARKEYIETAASGDLLGDNGLMKKVLKVYPSVSLVEGLSRTVQG